jgi:acyl carrier protein
MDFSRSKLRCSTSIEAKIISIIKDNLNISIPIEQININESLLDLGVNSITFVKIIVTIEAEFEFEFGDDDLNTNRFPTIQSLVSYVESKIG